MPAFALALSLVCVGGGTALRPALHTLSDLDRGSLQFGRSTTDDISRTSGSGVQTTDFEDWVRLEVRGERGRVSLPPAVTDNAGWFELDGLNVRDRSIQGVAALTALDRPNVYLDRQTGLVSIVSRHGTYVGTCHSARTPHHQLR